LITVSAFAQSDESIRQEVEKIKATHVENYNKQSAAGIAALYAKSATLVSPGGVSTSAEESFTNAFKAGFNHQEATVEEVSLIAPDVVVGRGEYTSTGQGPNGALQVHGRWTAVYVRESGVLKIRLLTSFPIPASK
jgi:ketosteroid isomerase-like protein